MKNELKEVFRIALKAQSHAHAPYSKFKVGAALVAGNHVFMGCNIENASYGATICGERSAIWKAVSEGFKDFESIVIVTSGGKKTAPCGMCLQVMSEFCKPNFKIYMAGPKGIESSHQLKDFLPKPFHRVLLSKKN